MITQTDLAKRVGPILTDGTAVRDLVDFDKHEISMRVNNDPALHRLELARVFARSWIALGHESEIPNHGDFVQRYHGEDRSSSRRATDGKVHALLNVCAHRGMEVCWADEGNQTQFKCPYHGWVFDNSGSLLGAPFEQEMYGDWDKSQYGLREGRVELRHGFVFVNFDRNAVSLEEWLGDMACYYDHNFAGVEWEPVGGQAFRWRFNGNWKTISDQNAGDMYHIAGAHRAIVEIGFMPRRDARQPDRLREDRVPRPRPQRLQPEPDGSTVQRRRPRCQPTGRHRREEGRRQVRRSMTGAGSSSSSRPIRPAAGR